MDDFAQSREPDDLFSDEIEPADYEATIVSSNATPAAPSIPTSSSQQEVAAIPPTGNQHVKNNQRGGRGGRRGGRGGQNPNFTPRADAPVLPVTAPQSTPQVAAEAPTSDPSAVENVTPTTTATPTAPANEDRVTSVRGDRSATGPAKPQKRTEAELADLMKTMSLKNAAKTEAHARAEKDQASFLHREQQAAAKRTEERKAIREQDMERAKNRERKIKAQGGREWDSEKVESDVVDGKNRGPSSRYMRGANGGVAGTATRGGLASSRFGGDDAEEPIFTAGRGVRGRGGDQGPRGRGGRGARGGRGRGGASTQVPPIDTEFPSLPSQPKPKTDVAKVEAAAKPEATPLPGLGGSTWAEEMATPIEKV